MKCIAKTHICVYATLKKISKDLLVLYSLISFYIASIARKVRSIFIFNSVLNFSPFSRKISFKASEEGKYIIHYKLYLILALILILCFYGIAQPNYPIHLFRLPTLMEKSQRI